jgi:predicted phosphate transport protein (TIGR00153 family)
MTLFRKSKVLEKQIDDFLDTIGEGALVFRDGVRAYLDQDVTSFEQKIANIDSLESAADKISREVEAHLYRHSLIPEHRGDVLGLLENTDNIIDRMKTSLLQFSVEQPDIPEAFKDGYAKLAVASCEAAESLVVAARTFFRDAAAVKDHLFKVHHFEKEADQISDLLKRRIFAAELELAHKIQLRYFATNVELVSDRAEEVADRLAIYAIKRNI